jgi:NADP-dependent 3-hydroxy acid dehydrogenase YdfG
METDLDTWRWAIDVNVFGIVHGIRSFGPLLIEQGEGHVVCTASVAGLSTTIAMGAYTATKHAVVGVAADAVHDAVLEDRLYVFPSPEVNDVIRQRLASVESALP